MLVEDLERRIEALAPRALAEAWDNVGLLVGRRGIEVRKVLVALDLTEDVVVEAVTGGYQAIVTHHPLIFAPLKRVTDGDRVGVFVTQLVAADVALLACHTNLDAAPGGLNDLVARELGLADLQPLNRMAAGVKKLVGFVPEEALGRVSKAVFAAGAGRIGAYEGCAFEMRGEGTFVPGRDARPAVGSVGVPERVPEVRFETVVPSRLVPRVVQALIDAHPYEEPTFDIYPVEDVLMGGGQGRVGRTRAQISLVSLAETAAEVFDLPEVCYAGDPEQVIDTVAVVTGSGSSLMEAAAGAADAFVTGDLKYHDADRAASLGLALLQIPHDHLETWALARWSESLAEKLSGDEVTVDFSMRGRSPWRKARPVSHVGDPDGTARLFDLEEAGGEARERLLGVLVDDRAGERVYLLHTDGASRGNPGPGAIGVVLEDEDGNVLEELGARIGTATNNQAEYQALLTGLETALDRGVSRVRVLSDSELLVRQLRQEYKVKNEQLKELYLQARSLIQRFERVEIKHVSRDQNARADELANAALDGTL
ncbi:MAG: Nif3-like dinuclear metal center hexameric protein [Thermoleophilia bacterium]